ncbi:hypothetical protein SISSUDRAFT_1066317 [Sistotremastrum suecicum HHB10207 ss-3]|uniref:Uncharacterized protein n=1 Tax=Sistotremastrum suecicum HHB10207 ss-3 TaxID=1314776 RepID=A0A165YGE0_9AGAM|nr:hypothetical protein SISSUDRAFT_1066317 [Sistotremastrum suecicum HHB10207 ss-3]
MEEEIVVALFHASALRLVAGQIDITKISTESHAQDILSSSQYPEICAYFGVATWYLVHPLPCSLAILPCVSCPGPLARIY